jgi:CDP-paratose synthetase
MKILLTGATGFLGTHLLADFLHRNHQVLIAKRASTNMSSLFQRFGKLEAWNIEGDELENMFRLHPNIDVIVHAATDYGRDHSRPTSTFWANEVFPIRLLELAIQNRTGLFVNMDTFFNSNNAAYDHLGAYTLSKRHFQEWGLHCATFGRIDFVNLRLFHLYGPGDGLEKFVPAMVKRCLEGDKIDLSDGEQKRDFIHIDDAVSAIHPVLEAELGHGHGYSHYDVGTGISVSIKDFMKTVHRVCGNGAKLNFGALPTRKGEFQDSCADTQALRALGWEPRVELETGIQSVITDAIQNEALIPENSEEKAE